MTSRERVLAAFNHIETDKVPVDFSGHRSSGISAIVYPKLREYLGLEPKPIRIYDPIQQLAIVDDDILERFEVDTIELGRGFALEDDSWADWILPDGTQCQMPVWTLPEREKDRWIIISTETGRVIAQMPDGALYFEQAYWPFAEGVPDLDTMPEIWSESMWAAIASPPGPQISGPDGQKLFKEGAKRLRERTDKAILGLFGGNLFEFGQFMYRNDNFFILLAGEPRKAHAFLDKMVEIHLDNLEKFLGAVGDYIDIIVFGDDLGMQTGPLISPKMYREFFKPRHKMLWNRAKELADVKVNLHCCGGIRELLPDIIEAGADAVNPVQTNCSGMNLGELKKDFGKDIVFWGGGCDTGHILPDETPETVAKHVKKQVEIGKKGGGFVFQQVHNIMANVPPENIVAMFDAVNELT
ncbi:MAG TPA: uroporphyrinogen decarboxylase family protein [Anaerolineae bacterium]|nr:uroporphyrinogen decarboxylase family protein [Anaerolineae bacterium]